MIPANFCNNFNIINHLIYFYDIKKTLTNIIIFNINNLIEFLN